MNTRSRSTVPFARLHGFLKEACLPAEFKREVLAALPDIARIDGSLLPPAENTPADAYFHEALELFERHNMVSCLLEALLSVRSLRAGEIAAIAELWEVDLSQQVERATVGAVVVDLPRPASPDEAERRRAVDRLAELLMLPESRSHGEMAERKREKMRLVEAIKRSFQPHAGAVVAGTVLEDMLDSGTFGQVWRSHVVGHPERKRATKIFLLDLLAQGRRLHHFRQGCRIMQILQLVRSESSPPAIVQFYGASADTLAFAMEYLPGGNLASVDLDRWSLDDKFRAFRRIAEAIQCAHRHGITHRDLYPKNIVLDEHGQPVITDLDLADADFFSDQKQSFAAGTRLYASPEQLAGKCRGEPVDDVYSLARLLHFLFLGADPPMTSDPAYESSLAPLPDGIAAVVRRATAPAVKDRYQTAAELLAAVEQARSGRAAAGVPSTASAGVVTDAGGVAAGTARAPVKATPIPSRRPPTAVVRAPETSSRGWRALRRGLELAVVLSSLVFALVLGPEGSIVLERSSDDTALDELLADEGNPPGDVDAGARATEPQSPVVVPGASGEPPVKPDPTPPRVTKRLKDQTRPFVGPSGDEVPVGPVDVEDTGGGVEPTPPEPPTGPEPPVSIDPVMTLTSAQEMAREIAGALDGCRRRYDPYLSDATFSLREVNDPTSASLTLERERSSHPLAQTTKCVGAVVGARKFASRDPDESLPARRFRLHLGTCVSDEGCTWRLESEHHGNGHGE